MSEDILKRLHFREIALRYLDDFNPAPIKAIVIADCICSYDGPILAIDPVRYQAHDFVQAAYRRIEKRQDVPAGNSLSTPWAEWLVEWVKKYGP
jgi:hypothetical protein